MEPGLFASSPFLPVIGWSVVLLVVHILLQGMTATRELGTAWNAGPRDEGLKPTARIAGRAERASANFRETYPAFVALALVLVLKGDASGWGLGGAWLVWLSHSLYTALSGRHCLCPVPGLGRFAGRSGADVSGRRPLTAGHGFEAKET